MVPWVEVGRAPIRGAGEIVLARRGDEFVIRAGGGELMNSRLHASEDALATLGCEALVSRRAPRVLVAGLGMGFTLRSALDVLPSDAKVTVVELVPAVVEWNRGPLAHLSNEALKDPRVEIETRDVAKVIKKYEAHFDAILMDVDNGPAALTAPSNLALYGSEGLAAARRALVKTGVYCVWSAADDPKFTTRLGRAGLHARTVRVPARVGGPKKHVVWIASVSGRKD